MDKCKKMGAQWKEDSGYTVAFIHQCTIPLMNEMSNRWKGVVASGVEESEQYEVTVIIRYEALENQRRTWNLGFECWQVLKCDRHMHFEQLRVTYLTPLIHMQQYHYTTYKVMSIYSLFGHVQYLQCMSCSERTPRIHPRSGGVEEREQYEDTVSIR